MIRLRPAVLLAAALTAFTSAAQPAPAPPSPAPASAEPQASVAVSGYVETFYQENFNAPSNLVTAYRGFDNRANSFSIENAVLDVLGSYGAVFTRVALQVGLTPSSYYSAEPVSPAVAGVGISGPELWRLIQQAYLGYHVPVGRGLLVEGGIFLSPIGQENLPIKDQWNWSRSDLFFALPYYHAGVRLTYPFSARWTGVVYVVNGWNDVINTNHDPCFMGLLTYSPGEQLTVNLLYFGGVERPIGAPEGLPWRNLFDATATWRVAPRLWLAAEANAGMEHGRLGVSSWEAAAAYARVQLTGWLYLSGRYDVFFEQVAHDALGSAGHLFFPADRVRSGTVTADFRPAHFLSLRLEYRHDAASAPIYFSGAVPVLAGVPQPDASEQNTLTLGAVAWF